MFWRDVNHQWALLHLFHGTQKSGLKLTTYGEMNISQETAGGESFILLYHLLV